MTIPKGFSFAFKISDAIHVYSNEKANLNTTENDLILSTEDFFWNKDEKRPATKEEFQNAINSVYRPQLPEAEAAAALVRVLSGAKAKRVKTKVIVQPKEEEEESDFSESGEEDDDDDEEDEYYEED